MTSYLTFQHLDGHLGEARGLVFIDSDGFGEHHLTKATFAQRLPQRQPENTQTPSVSQLPHNISMALPTKHLIDYHLLPIRRCFTRHPNE